MISSVSACLSIAFKTDIHLNYVHKLRVPHRKHTSHVRYVDKSVVTVGRNKEFIMTRCRCKTVYGNAEVRNVTVATLLNCHVL